MVQGDELCFGQYFWLKATKHCKDLKLLSRPHEVTPLSKHPFQEHLVWICLCTASDDCSKQPHASNWQISARKHPNKRS